MALENRAQKTKREALEALPRIVQATNDPNAGFTYCSKDIVDWLVKNGLAEGDENTKNEAGAVACRATEKGKEKIMSEQQNAVVTEGAAVAFEIETGYTVPAAKRGGARKSPYPFDALEVGQSFFIPASEKHPEPAKTLASTVSAATKRYDEEIPGKTREVMNPKTKEKRTVPAIKHTRVFQIRPAEKDGVKGARVFRTV